MERLKKGIAKFKKEQKEVQKEVKEKTIGYILGALGLVAGLAWNEAIKSSLAVIFPTPGNDLLVKFIYAVIVTTVIVVASVYLARMVATSEEVKL